MKLTDAEVAALVTREIELAQGYDADVLAGKREEALDLYNGAMVAAPEGRSGIVSMDVADAVHAVLAQIQPIIKTTMLEFEPNGEDDEAQAQAESDFVRKAMTRAGGYQTIFEAIHDALLIANGWLKITVETDTDETSETFAPDLPDEAIYYLSQPTAAEQVVTVKASATKTTVKRKTTTHRLNFEAIPPENMLFSEGRGVATLQDQRFVGERKLYTKAALKALGVSDEVIATCPDGDAVYWPAVAARQGEFQFNSDMGEGSEKLKVVYCCYVRFSMADNNVSELRYVWISGSNILKNESVEWVPYITGSAIPYPHRVQGKGLADLLEEIQTGKTHILRNYMDNLEVMNASRVGAVEGQVNLDDLTNGRINGVVRVRNSQALFPLPSNDIGGQAMGGLGYLDQVRVQRIGASLDMNETQAQLMSSSATAAAGTLGQVEKMSGWFASNLVETLLKPAFLMVHRLLRTELGGPMKAKLRGKWVDDDSSRWEPRDQLEIVMGMTTAEKAHRIQALTGVISQQAAINAQGGGGILVDNKRIYNAMADWLRANDLGQPEQYILDPDSPQAQQAAQQQAQSQQQQQQQMQAMQEQLLQMQHAFELQKQENDLGWKTWNARLDAEIEEAKLTSSAKLTLIGQRASVEQREAADEATD